jgi:phosphatidylinositol 4-kinase
MQVNTVEFQAAKKNFIESMAAYSVVSYILNVIDTMENILIDEQGHVIHIDFGFLFDTQPGGKFGNNLFPSN